MPKRARQAHIPPQIRKRKPRRGAGLPGEASAGEDYAFENESEMDESVVAELPRSPSAARPHRRLELLARSREPTAAATLRTLPGQLPTFERAYLINELRRISITAGALLAVIIVLALVIRS